MRRDCSSPFECWCAPHFPATSRWEKLPEIHGCFIYNLFLFDKAVHLVWDQTFSKKCTFSLPPFFFSGCNPILSYTPRKSQRVKEKKKKPVTSRPLGCCRSSGWLVQTKTVPCGGETMTGGSLSLGQLQCFTDGILFQRDTSQSEHPSSFRVQNFPELQAHTHNTHTHARTHKNNY